VKKKNQWGHALLSVKINAAVSCKNHHEKIMQLLKKRRKRGNRFGCLATFWFGTLKYFFTPLGACWS